MKSVLVTGASGFIGSHTAERFAREGWRTFAFVHRHTSPYLRRLIVNGQVEPLSGDLGEVASVQTILATCCEQVGAPLDAIAHCAGRATDVGWSSAFRRANYDPVRFLGQATVSGAARRLIFVSTADVYGLIDHHQADEDHTPLRAVPRHPYPLYKIRAESWLRQNVPAELWTIVRPGAVWGPDDPTLTVRIIDFLRHSPMIIHFGPWRGANRWPLAHVDNVAQGIFLAATLDDAVGRAVNILDSEYTTIDEFYHLIAATFLPGRTFRTIYLPFWAGWAPGTVISSISDLLNLRHPFADLSLYALYTISHNLDFSNARWLGWMTATGRCPIARKDGFGQLNHPVQDRTQ